MAGFIRRYGYFPGVETITLIEGVVIVDLPPPGSVNGIGTGTVCVVGEFPDMSYAVAVDTSGNVTTKCRPVELSTAQDMLDKVGRFDETLGDTGAAGGSGFIGIRNKKYSRLVAAPVNLCSAAGVRMFRELPTCTSSTNPAPAVLLTAGTVAAGREFKNGANRVRSGARKVFTSTGQYAQGVDGAVTAAGAPAPTQVFGSAGSLFLSAKNSGPVKKGDILVIGVISGAGALGANAATYRVTADASTNTQLTVEKLDGAVFDWTSGVTLPFRVHPASDADTGDGTNAADVGGYVVPARPLDATIAGAITMAPTVVPPTPTATFWDPLSGLKMRTMPTTGLAYTATIQAPNAVNDATLDALYSAALTAMLADEVPTRDINIVVSARHSSTIRSSLKAHVLAAASVGLGRMAIISPPLTSQTVDAVVADADPGVGANRAERVIYDWPGAQTFIPEAVGFNMKGADALVHTDGILDTHFDGWMASLLSNLPPERNPGQAASPVPEVFAPILGLQRGVSGLSISDYTRLRQYGIAGLRIDRSAGPLVQSGVTTSLTSGEKNINRRRMADFLEDSLAQRYNQFAKLPITNAWKDSLIGETDAFLVGLLSENNPPAQRIVGYLIDPVSGNTLDTEARGIYVLIVKVRTLATADFIVLQAEVGEGVNVTAT